jgi:hypothetical protein
LHGGELLRRHQVLVEVFELPRALHPHITRAQFVFQLGQGAQLVKAPVETSIRFDQSRPAWRDEFFGGVLGTCLALLEFIKRKASMASNTSLAAGAARSLRTSRNSGA